MIEYLPLVLTGIGIIVAIVYYTLTLRNANKTQQMQLETRQAQLFMQIFDKITSLEGIEQIRIIRNAEWSTHDEWVEIYFNDEKYRNAFSWFITIMEGFGVLMREGLVDVRLVALFIGAPSLEMWESHREIVFKERERRNMKSYGREWEYSSNALKKYLEEHPELAL